MDAIEIEIVYDWIQEHLDNESTRYFSMTYEQGIQAVLDILSGEGTVEDLIES